MTIKPRDDDITYIKRILHELYNAFNVVKEILSRDRLSISDRYAMRYAIIEIVESLALIAHRLAKNIDYPLEGYVDAMKFYAKHGILDNEAVNNLVRLVRLRNLLVHRYREIDDNRIIMEARNNGLETIRRALDGIRRFIER